MAVPLVDTCTSLPGLASETFFLTWLTSSGVKEVTLVTGVLEGTFGMKSWKVATLASLGCDIFPASSVALAVTLPFGISLVGSINALPLALATPWPSSWSPWS